MEKAFLWRKVYSISSGSSDRIIPVLSAYRWSPRRSHPAEIDAHVAFADAFASRADRNRRQRLNTNVQFLKVVNLAHRAIDHQPFPFILDGQTRQVSVN